MAPRPTVLTACSLSLKKSPETQRPAAIKTLFATIRIWQRISPPGDKGLVCTFTQAAPAGMAAMAPANSPALSCRLGLEPTMTFAAVILPVTSPLESTEGKAR